MSSLLHLFISCLAFLFSIALSCAQSTIQTKSDTIGYGWAKTSVNVAVFRKNSLVTHKGIQYASYYDSSGYVILAKRNTNEGKWEVQRTTYKGNVADAHNTISIMIDGDGYLHLAWNHHNNELHYARSITSGSLQLTEPLQMTGDQESNVTYPEFHRLPSGDLIFMYRNGASGEGNLIMNKYQYKTKQWLRLHTNLIDGEKNAMPIGKRTLIRKAPFIFRGYGAKAGMLQLIMTCAMPNQKTKDKPG